MIFCKSRRAAERTLTNIVPFIENKLFLNVNKSKTVVDYVGRVKFLGVSFYVKEGQARVLETMEENQNQVYQPIEVGYWQSKSVGMG